MKLLKQLFCMVIFFVSPNLMSMSYLPQWGKIAPRKTQRTIHPQLIPSRNFGRTHFILGYDQPSSMLSVPKIEPIIIVSQQPPIIDGSSAHLIDESRLIQSFCSLEHNISSIVLSLLEQAERTVDIAAFSLTDSRIAKQLMAARKRGVEVCVIMDPANMKQIHSKSKKLIDDGVPVWRYDSSLRQHTHKKNAYEELMHLKLMIVDNKTVVEGSANFTRSAQDGHNIESITICRCPQFIHDRCRLFNLLKTCCRECKKEIVADA